LPGLPKRGIILEKHAKKQVRKMNSFIPVTDFASPGLDVYARLSENQLFHINEPGPGLFIAESPKVIGRALAAGCGAVSFLIEERQLIAEAEEVLAKCPDVPVYTASEEVFRQLTGFVLTRGMLAAMRRPERPS
jgi:tRNA G18 (ribose-2'-O)-methylase SpoU